MEQITLYFKQGGSDKVYQAAIEKKDGGYVVTFAYGRRGTTLQTGTKTQSPINCADAKRIYDKLVAEKMAKGYTPGESGTPYQQTDKAKQATGILPQLLNPIEEDAVQALIENPDYCEQEKHNGKRRLLKAEADTVTGINKMGLVTGIPISLEQSARVFGTDFTMDGEAVDDPLFAFDLLFIDGRDIRPQAYRERLLHLMNLLGSAQQSIIRLVETAFDTAQKTALFNRVRKQNGEGVVFKRLAAPYTPGRPASGGDQFKYQFRATASFIVTKLNARRSVSLGLWHGSELVHAGNVTIPANHAIPCVRGVVEVRYLYAFPESGCIFQPVYLGSRDDIAESECTVTQLKYKAASVAA